MGLLAVFAAATDGRTALRSGPKCSRCRSGDYDCVYEESRKVPVNESYASMSLSHPQLSCLPGFIFPVRDPFVDFLRYLRNLEAKAKAYDGAWEARTVDCTATPLTGRRITSISPRTGPFSGAGPKRRGSNDENDDEFEDEHVLLGPFTQLSIDRPSTSFKGQARPTTSSAASGNCLVSMEMTAR